MSRTESNGFLFSCGGKSFEITEHERFFGSNVEFKVAEALARAHDCCDIYDGDENGCPADILVKQFTEEESLVFFWFLLRLWRSSHKH